MAEARSVTFSAQQAATLLELAARLSRFGSVVEAMRDACAVLGLSGAEEGLGETASNLLHSAGKIERLLEEAESVRADAALADNITRTGLAPAGFLDDLHAIGRYGPFHVDPVRTACVVDREGHDVAVIVAVEFGRDFRRKLAELLAADLTHLEIEARAIRDPFDPNHLNAVSEQSRALGERLARRRSAAE